LVTNDNIVEIEELLHQGKIKSIIVPERYKGSSFAGSTRAVLPGHKYNIEVGYTVERYLQDGDVVVISRQPTIHKYNVMAFNAKLQKGSGTLRLHLSVTGPFNADFDGDELNVHLPQSQESRDEAITRMHVYRNIISELYNKPVIALTFDSITGAYKMTRPDTHITKGKEVLDSRMDIATIYDAHTKYSSKTQLPSLSKRLEAYGIDPKSGIALFSSVLPEDFHYKKGDVLISNGVLRRGQIKSDHIGTAHGSIIQVMHKTHGWRRTSEFITDATYAIRVYIDHYNYSIGFRDCAYGQSPYSKEVVEKSISQAESQLLALGPRPAVGTLEAREYERKREGITRSLESISTKLVMPGKNPLTKQSKGMTYMSDNQIFESSKGTGSGAKGSVSNTSQIGGFVGQQAYGGRSIQPVMCNNQRALSTFRPGDNSLAAGGFCKSNFSQGLTSSEMYFHLQGSREGLTDTALKVPEIGDLHRKLAKAMEGLIVSQDRSIRDSDENIYQFLYGDDGLDASHLMNVSTSSTPKTVTFIDAKMLASKYNAKYGYVPR
jgi:DNA-directed RNA polymerase beta' subunit